MKLSKTVIDQPDTTSIASYGDSLFLKPGAEVIIFDDYVAKKMGPNEVQAYRLLETYSNRLHAGKFSITIPRLISFNAVTGWSIVEKIGDFKIFSPSEYF